MWELVLNQFSVLFQLHCQCSVRVFNANQRKRKFMKEKCAREQRGKKPMKLIVSSIVWFRIAL